MRTGLRGLGLNGLGLRSLGGMVTLKKRFLSKKRFFIYKNNILFNYENCGGKKKWKRQ
jgi:hypothetical protein